MNTPVLGLAHEQRPPMRPVTPEAPMLRADIGLGVMQLHKSCQKRPPLRERRALPRRCEARYKTHQSP